VFATRNRLDPHPVPPPDDVTGRHDFLSDAILRAVAATARLLGDDDPAVVLKAAKMLLDLEKTRMRHGRRVLGVPDPYQVETAKMLGPIWGNANPVPLENADDYDDYEDEDVPEAYVPCPAAGPPVREFEREPDVQPRPDEWTERPPPGESEFQRWLKAFRSDVIPPVVGKGPAG